MRVRELIALLQAADPEAEVVVSSHDHSFTRISRGSRTISVVRNSDGRHDRRYWAAVPEDDGAVAEGRAVRQDVFWIDDGRY